jgi:hypothetical protein
MARTPQLPTEYVTAEDGYDIVFRRRGVTVAEKTWAAQVRLRPGGPLVAEFEVTAVDGEDEHEGKAIIALHLDPAVTLQLPAEVRCDLQENTPDAPPITLARWTLVVEGQVTQ